jgi:hypothetical protein
MKILRSILLGSLIFLPNWAEQKATPKIWGGSLTPMATSGEARGGGVVLQVYKYHEWTTGQEFYFVVAVARDDNNQPQVSIHSLQAK